MICGVVDRKEELIEAIKHYSSPLWHTIGVVGGAAATDYCEDSRVLELPIRSEKKLEIIWKGGEWILQKWPTACGFLAAALPLRAKILGDDDVIDVLDVDAQDCG